MANEDMMTAQEKQQHAAEKLSIAALRFQHATSNYRLNALAGDAVSAQYWEQVEDAHQMLTECWAQAIALKRS